MGTVLGGGVLALIAVAAGAIHGVSLITVSWVFLAFAIVGVIAQVFFLSKAGSVARAAKRRERQWLEGIAEQYSEEDVSSYGIWAMLSAPEREELMQIYAERRPRP